MRLAACGVAALLAGCPAVSYPRREPVVPPAAPTPIAGLNTEWDDYNAAKPPGLDQIVYSTNRGSRGGDLDVWYVGVQWGREPRTIGEPRPYASALMSKTDERGPLVMSAADFVADSASGAALAFSSARSGGAGGLDLYWGHSDGAVAHRLEHLSSAGNDAYMTTKFASVMSPRVLFASDRFGAGYDIFEATWDGYQIGGPPLTVRRVDALSTSADDTAPFVASNGSYTTADIVFASKRDGARGWDLYCSHYDGATYSAPVPITIANSEHDEFRPSIAEAGARLLVFSSNRPGGAGGYDLYAVAFDGCAPRANH